MGQTPKAPRENRTITVDFQDESTYFQLIHDGKAFVEFVLAFILSLNWLRLLGSTKTPQIDQGVGHQLHAVVAPLDALETQQQSLEFVLPRKCPFHAVS